MECPDPTLHDPDAQPVQQLLYSVLHTRRTLDDLDLAIEVGLAQEREQAEQYGEADPLFTTPLGNHFLSHLTRLRDQLSQSAKLYISLGIEERQVKVFEEWANLLLPLLTNLLDDPDLNLTRAQRRAAPEIIERHLVALEPPSADNGLETLLG